MTEKPKITREVGAGGWQEEVETHPAYGQISISRCTGEAKLFGSALDKHSSYISLTIRHSKRHHHLHRDWYHPRDPITEVVMSHAQFAELITTLNMGGGTPCTIRTLPGHIRVPGIPYETKTEASKVVDGFKDGQAELVKALRALVADAVVLLGKKGAIGKRDRSDLMAILEYVLREVEANRPFAVQSFQEAAEKVVTQSKAEVEAMLTMSLHKLGLEKLEDLKGLLGDTSYAGARKKLK